MERLEYILQNQLKSIATLFENVPLNMNIKTETKNPTEPKPSPESLNRLMSKFFFDSEVQGHIPGRLHTFSGARKSDSF